MLTKLKKLLFNSKSENNRDFIEIYRTNNKDDAEVIKKKLEKHKIPVYLISKMQSINKNDLEQLIRIPRKFEAKANEILQQK